MKKLAFVFCAIILLGALCFPAHAEEGYELLENGDFEQITATWEKYYLATVDYCQTAHSGNGALMITSRQHSTDIAKQHITKQLAYYGPGTYEFSAWIRLADPQDQPVNLQIAIGVYCKENKYWITSDWVRVTSEWTLITAQRSISWAGELETAEFYIVSNMGGEEDGPQYWRDLILDDCSMKTVSYAGQPYAPETNQAPTTEEQTTAPDTADTQPETPENSADATDEPTETVPDTEAPSGQVSTQTRVIAGTMIAVGVILLACAVALTVSFVRGKRHEASN